jgi:prostaglandin-endoperoxide synthase 2
MQNETKRQLEEIDMLRANQLLKEVGLDQLLLDSSRQNAGRIGLGNTGTFLLDVKKVSIEMARGCRLPTFNAYRKHYGLKPITSFEELTGETLLAGKLEELYGDIDRLEWFVGLFAEGYDKASIMGELLVTMVANDAFTQALTNPLLAKAVYCEDTFSKEGLAINKSNRTLADVVACNTSIRGKGEVGFKVRTAPGAEAVVAPQL